MNICTKPQHYMALPSITVYQYPFSLFQAAESPPAMSKALLVSPKCHAQGHRAHRGRRWGSDQILSTPQKLSNTDIFLTCVNYFMKIVLLVCSL